ncbi:cupin domain-containing protein [Acidisoma sp. 7E03]
MATIVKASLEALLARLPGRETAVWPEGVPFADAFRHGTMSVEIFAPRGTDRQSAHAQDELYVVAAGRARFEHEGAFTETKAGDVLFVPAGDDHRFHDMSEDFATWVIFWGPTGGEAERHDG